MITSLEAEKVFAKIPTSFHNKNNKLEQGKEKKNNPPHPDKEDL